MQRRHFIRSALGGAASSVFGLKARRAGAASARFEHGVASGDPLADRVILWTRVTGLEDDGRDVGWVVATNAALSSVVVSGKARARRDSDYTVKVDAGGLPAGRALYYAFECDGVTSPVGRTRTLPRGAVDTVRFAVVSCSNYPHGFFHVYADIAHHDDIDAVVHLGDYIYEYGLGEYATEYAKQLDRVPRPSGPLLTLADYRQRHAQYKADADSKAMHGRHPMIAIWDDHELANDAWKDGAQNHTSEQGDWSLRRDAAIQAWLEWMPVRVSHDRGRTRTFRDFEFGDLATLVMLDTRVIGRDRQPDAGPDVTSESVEAAMRDPDRRLLGREQEEWLRKTLERASKTTWQVIGQQVMVCPTRSPDLEALVDLDAADGPQRETLPSREALERYIAISKNNPPMLLDTWNGYPAARQAFLADLATCADNPVVLSGDLHTSLAGNLVPHGADKPVAVELMTSSVTSPGFAEYLPQKTPNGLRDATLAINPMLAYMETQRRGWLDVTLTAKRCVAEWRLVDTVHRRAHEFSVDCRLSVEAGKIDRGLVAP